MASSAERGEAELPPVRPAAPLEQRVGDDHDVLRALAQRREGQVHDRETIEEILAEPPRLQLGLQILVGRGDDAGVDAEHLAAPDALELTLLQKAEELDLQRRAHLADLVEEERAAVRQLELALSLRVRAGVGAALVAEQLGLEQGVRDRAAVDRHERPVAPRAVRVDGPRQELLARSTLALDQHGDVGPRDAAHDREDLAHRGRVSQHVRELDRGLVRALLGLGLERPEMDRPLEHDLQVLQLDRLLMVVERAELDRANRAVAAAVLADDHDLGRRLRSS